MGLHNSPLIAQKVHANFRLRDVSGYKTDLLEIRAQDPTFHVLFIPGNPGVVSFYIDFLEILYELLGGTASITAVGHVFDTEKNWKCGRLFSLEEQIDHKVDFIKQEFENIGVPIMLVGHSIGSYISMEILRRSPEKVIYYIGLYPFLAVNTESPRQSIIRRLAMSPVLSVAVSSIAGFLGLLPTKVSKCLVTNSIGKSWSASAVKAMCTHVLQFITISLCDERIDEVVKLYIDEYHTMRNVLFMAMTEFKKLSETPDWVFMRGKQSQIAFLFGANDHWGPLRMFDEISKNVPDAALAVEREGFTHAFSCTRAGSLWVAQHVASLIKNQKTSSSQ